MWLFVFSRAHASFPQCFGSLPLSHIKCPHVLGSACQCFLLFADLPYLRFVKIAVTRLWVRDSGVLSGPSTVQSQPKPRGKAQTERLPSAWSVRGPCHRIAVDITAAPAAPIMQQLHEAQPCLQSRPGQPVRLVLGEDAPNTLPGARRTVCQSVLHGSLWGSFQ